jgi:hypothetical protein
MYLKKHLLIPSLARQTLLLFKPQPQPFLLWLVFHIGYYGFAQMGLTLQFFCFYLPNSWNYRVAHTQAIKNEVVKKFGMVGWAYNPSTWEAEAGGILSSKTV